MGIRKPYMKLCQHGNTEITYIVKNGAFEVTFEQAVNGGFKTAVFKRQRNRNAGRRKHQKRIRKQYKRKKKPQRGIAR